MGEVHSLYPHNSALSGTLKHIDLKAFFTKIKYGEKKFFKIAVVSAVDKYCTLAFACRNGVHNRKLYIFKGHVKFFYNSIFTLKEIRIILIKKLGSFKIVFFLVRVAVIHKKLAHTVICNGIFGAFLAHRLVAESNKLTLPVCAYLYL